MSVDVIGGGRPRRFCDVCTQADDHPRHVTVLEDGTTHTRHMDCCAQAGCIDGSCEAAGASRGAELLAHITGGGQ